MILKVPEKYSICIICVIIFLSVNLFFPLSIQAAEDIAIPNLQLTLSGGQTEPEKVSLLLEILFMLTVLSLAPAIMLTVTSFTRIIIVLIA